MTKKEKRGRKKAPVTKNAFLISRVHQEQKDILILMALNEGLKLSRIVDYAIAEFIENHSDKYSLNAEKQQKEKED